MRFSSLPIGSCFARGKRTHRKAGPRSYLENGFGAEKSIKAGANVKPAMCFAIRPLVELGRAKILK